MDILLFPENAIPSVGTKARHYLDLVLQGPVKEHYAMLLFKGNQRSPIQILGGDKGGHWLLHSIRDENGLIISRELDWRHLSGDKALDTQARRERKKMYKASSCKDALQGHSRMPKAIADKNKSQAEYFMGLDAANDASNKKTSIR
tara:strand:- start:1144 stop:1581 length:438 start_codon:yes stop_codon:yes gene_type:complete